MPPIGSQERCWSRNKANQHSASQSATTTQHYQSEDPADQKNRQGRMARKEITVRVVVLSVLLAIILGAANVYLGLFAGLTVSASIPAAIISMSILRTIYGNDVDLLENNLVQTAASAGESLAAGVIFTFPALVMMNENDDDHLELKGWSSFKYTETVILAICGGEMPPLSVLLLFSSTLLTSDLTRRCDGNHVQHTDTKSIARGHQTSPCFPRRCCLC
jgi:hypothetical protein